ncbi:unnamed protein product [Gadus morhua 'NCC']
MATAAMGDTDVAALATRDDQLAATAGGTNESASGAAGSGVALCQRGAGAGSAQRSLVRVLVKATIRRHTTVTYVRLGGARNQGGAAGALPRAGAPELLLRSELSFVMSSSVLLSSPSHS